MLYLYDVILALLFRAKALTIPGKDVGRLGIFTSDWNCEARRQVFGGKR